MLHSAGTTGPGLGGNAALHGPPMNPQVPTHFRSTEGIVPAITISN
jgi:hypothetical protein